MAAITALEPKLAKPLPRLGSNHDSQIVATVTALHNRARRAYR